MERILKFSKTGVYNTPTQKVVYVLEYPNDTFVNQVEDEAISILLSFDIPLFKIQEPEFKILKMLTERF